MTAAHWRSTYAASPNTWLRCPGTDVGVVLRLVARRGEGEEGGSVAQTPSQKKFQPLSASRWYVILSLVKAMGGPGLKKAFT